MKTPLNMTNKIFGKTLITMLLLTLGAMGAWGQDDLSGFWFIASAKTTKSVAYNVATPATNYYMVPAQDPQRADNQDAYFSANYSVSAGDPEKPFLATYRTNQDNNSVWQLMAVDGESGFYYIKHFATGKYVIYEPPYTGSTAHRKTMHLLATDSPGENAKFEVTANGTSYNFRPKSVTTGNRYFNVAGGNSDSYYGGSSSPYHTGLIGIYNDAGDAGSLWKLEATTSPPVFTVNADGSVGMTAEAEATIYYTTDDSDPSSAESTRQSYTAAITPTDAMVAIKAVAISTGGVTSNVVTLQLVSYTYNVVNRQGNIAIQHTVKQAVGKPLSGYTAIPESIRSPYIADETVTFYALSDAYTTSDQLTDENQVTATTTTATIYVTYTTSHLPEKFLKLRAARMFNITVGGEYIYDDSGTLSHESSDANKSSANRMWYIGSDTPDPYAVQLRNASTKNVLGYATPSTLAVAAAPANKNFILMATTTGSGDAYEQMELMAATGNANYYRVGYSAGTLNISATATGDASLQVRAYPNSVSVNYYLIDKAGKLIEGPISSESAELALPAAWVSPLVSEYHYYSTSGYDSDTDTYSPTGTVTSPADVGSGGSIYVTYDVGTAIDLTGTSNYLLKFSGGEEFYQENGSDAVMGTKQKAVYPYNNGDFNLYVYGQEQWESQLASGASTRTRWLWHFVSDNTDPYHVRVKSHQNHTVKDKDLDDISKDKNYGPGCSYLQTYKPSDYSSVITNIAYENEAYSTAYPAKMPTSMVNGQPTEYMMLGTSLQSLTLKTFNEVEGERRVVNSFEQYWKNNPTVKGLVGENPAADNALLTEMGWHQFTSWAFSAPWGSSTKALAEDKHWYQTISMGSTFSVEEVSLEPQVILLDQHGWEIVRIPLSDEATLRKYDSPMVHEYHWYPTATKVGGYHKYTVSDQNIPVYNSDRKVIEGQSFTHNSSTLAYTPYDYFETIREANGWVAQDDRVKSDFYVTYTVKTQYADTYTAAATADETVASAYLLKQGGNYAKTSDGASITTEATASVESAPTNMQWYLRPNFNIDREMGYKYAGETGAQDGALSKEATDAANYGEGRNGFDPYNVQIQSRAYPQRYFTANTTGSVLSGGAWTGTSSSVNLQNMRNDRQTAAGYDHTTLNITNATFMVVDDGNGNMRLMPRFDHGKVVTSLTTLSAQLTAAAAGDNGTGTQTIVTAAMPREIHSSDEMNDMNGYYVLASDFTFASGFTSFGTAAKPFTGVIDGQFNTLASPGKAIVGYANGATIKNIILGNVNIDGNGHIGAICNEATGATRIYNCGVRGGMVTSSDAACGGLVGHVVSGSNVRVVNCYNYATVSGSTYAAGIVGWNQGTVDGTTTVSGTGVRIANCMMYGKITSGTTSSPVYCGNHTNNQQKLTEYNFWRTHAYTSDETAYTAYNDQLAIGSDENLYRFPFYRHILNTHREMAAYFLFADHTDAHVAEIGHWVLKTDVAPYPILEPWETNITKTLSRTVPTTDAEYAGKKLAAMGNSGELTVTVKIGSENYEAKLPITDMDTLRYDYTWGKVVLPYANEFGGWERDYDYVCTGWKITSVTKDDSELTAFNIPDDEPYNFADRDNPQKDIYHATNNPYVFAQGGNYIVPYGVTAITIEAHFARAYYLSDPYSDVGYTSSYGDATNLGWQVSTTYHEKPVYTSLSTLVGQLSNATNPNDQAIVLVGNFHHLIGSVGLNSSKAVTIMSCDEDNNQEPDYAWYMGNTTGRIELPPIRFDLPVIEIGMAARVNNSSWYPGVGIWHVHGWFELTENSVNNSSQFEINSSKCNNADDGKGINRWIANSGCFVQVVRCRASNCSKLSYIQVGGNAYIKELYPGSHTDNGNVTTSVPIMVTGGQVDECFMTGYTSKGGKDNKAGTLSGDMIYFWSAGGKIKKFLGAYLEEPTSAGLTAKIDHARIYRFFGGGTSAAARIKGNIDITINNSKVDFYCGGPEFGDMYEGKTLTTHAIGTTFGEYYGAGFGGTSITYVRKAQNDNLAISSPTSTYDLNFSNYTDNRLIKDATYGIGTCYKFEFIFNSNAKQLVTRFYTGYAQFSLATTGSVTNDLTNCIVENDFYGAGCQGKVSGSVTSTLTNCEVRGSAFGGGFKAESNELKVYTITPPTYSVFTKETGLFSDFGEFPTPDTYTWVQGTSNNKNTVVSDQTQIYTDVTMSDLGNVTGAITLTIDGGSVAENVYGGGNESKSLNNTRITIKGGSQVTGDVFGGGNQGNVSGSTTVNIQE